MTNGLAGQRATGLIPVVKAFRATALKVPTKPERGRMNRIGRILAGSMMVFAMTAAATLADEPGGIGPQKKSTTPASLAKLAEEVVSRIIAGSPLAESGLDRRIRAEFVEIVTKYGPARPSGEFMRSLLDGLDAYLHKIYPKEAQLDDPVRRDEAYLGMLPTVRDLQWKLYLAVARRPLDKEARDRLEEQHDWMRKHIRSLPYPALLTKRPQRDDKVYEQALADLEAKISDVLCPSFKSPLSEDDFDTLQDKLAEYKIENELLYVVPHMVWEEARLQFDDGTRSFPRLKALNDKQMSLSSFNGTLSLGSVSTRAAYGMYNRIDAYQHDFIDLSDDAPTVRAIQRPADLKLSTPPTLEELDLLVTAQGWGQLVFDNQELRLIGIKGTKLVPLEVRRWIEVDRLPRQEILDLLKERGSTVWKLPEPIKKGSDGTLHYDAMAAVLTPADRLWIIQPREFGHGSFAFHVRQHDPLGLGRKVGNLAEEDEE